MFVEWLILKYPSNRLFSTTNTPIDKMTQYRTSGHLRCILSQFFLFYTSKSVLSIYYTPSQTVRYISFLLHIKTKLKVLGRCNVMEYFIGL